MKKQSLLIIVCLIACTSVLHATTEKESKAFSLDEPTAIIVKKMIIGIVHSYTAWSAVVDYLKSKGQFYHHFTGLVYSEIAALTGFAAGAIGYNTFTANGNMQTAKNILKTVDLDFLKSIFARYQTMDKVPGQQKIFIPMNYSEARTLTLLNQAESQLNNAQELLMRAQKNAACAEECRYHLGCINSYLNMVTKGKEFLTMPKS